MDESMETRYGVLLAAVGWHDVRLLANSGINRASARLRPRDTLELLRQFSGAAWTPLDTMPAGLLIKVLDGGSREPPYFDTRPAPPRLFMKSSVTAIGGRGRAR